MEETDGIIENNQNNHLNSENKKRTKEDILKSRKLMMQYGKNLKNN